MRKPLRIGFDAKRAYFNRSGLGNYSRNLINALSEHYSDAEAEFFLFTPRTKGGMTLEHSERLHVVSPQSLVHRMLPAVWRSQWSVNDMIAHGLDVYHGLSHELPWGIHHTRIRTVLTVHDLIFMRRPQDFNPIDVYIYTKKIKYACHVADAIVAISNQTRHDIEELLDVPAAHITLIPQGCNPIFQHLLTSEQLEAVRRKWNLPTHYLLNVGTIEQRKNLIAILQAMYEYGIDLPLVVIGQRTAYCEKIIAPYIASHRMESRVRIINALPDTDLPAVYQMAAAFVYPSLYEGFGIPVIEALSSGIPVITSAGTCLEETGGAACLYVHPTDITELAEAMKHILTDSTLRADLADKAKVHLARFAQSAIAEEYMNLYQSLV